MDTQLTNFFAKYPQKYSIISAIKLIEKEVECAKDSYKEDKESKEYLKYLKTAYEMIEDLFDELGVHPNSIP